MTQSLCCAPTFCHSNVSKFLYQPCWDPCLTTPQNTQQILILVQSQCAIAGNPRLSPLCCRKNRRSMGLEMLPPCSVCNRLFHLTFRFASNKCQRWHHQRQRQLISCIQSGSRRRARREHSHRSVLCACDMNSKDKYTDTDIKGEQKHEMSA